jgi:hypothetical protein
MTADLSPEMRFELTWSALAAEALDFSTGNQDAALR